MVRMQNRTLFITVAALSSACLVTSFAGCGSSSSGTNPPADSGAGTDTSTGTDSGPVEDTGTPSEAGAGDTGTTPPADGGSPEGGGTVNCANGVKPTGTPLIPSTTLTLQGITTDNQVILYDTAAKSLSAVPLAGGTPAMIDPYDQTGLATVGKVLYYFHGASTASPAIDTLSIWTAAAGKVELAPAAYDAAGTLAISNDSSIVVYTKNATATHADIWWATTNGSNNMGTALVTNTVFDANCQPSFQFAGNTNILVAAFCPTLGDGGPEQATLEAFSGASFGTTQVFSTAAFFGFTTDKTGTQVAYTTANGQYVQAISPTGATTVPTPIDANGVGGAAFSPDGTKLYYLWCQAPCASATGVSLYLSPVASAAPALIAGPFEGNYGVSPNGNFIEAYKGLDAAEQFSDLYITATTAGSTPVALVPTTTSAFFSQQWTTDGTHALYFGNVVGGTSGYTGDFGHAALSGTPVPTLIAHNVWQGNATTAAKVLYNDNYVLAGPLYGYADIESLDLGGTAAATKLVTAADANYFVTSDMSTIVYSFSACPNNATPGIYTMAAP